MTVARLLLALQFVGWVSLQGMPAHAQSAPQNSREPSARQSACPWLTAGSAARALGGDVSVTVTVASEDEGSCRFARHGDSMDTLEIQVGASGVSACAADSPKLVGIGNEAARCRPSAAHGEMAEMISGHVRNRYFSLTLRQRKRGGNSSDDPGSDPLEQVAEQVAGNLF
jgi:hypothetical protein